jgi:hypothetical protein
MFGFVPRAHLYRSFPAHSASLRAFTPVFDGLWTRVNALMLAIQSPHAEGLGPRFRGDERMLCDRAERRANR